MTMNNERPRLKLSADWNDVMDTVTGWWAEWAETRHDRRREGKTDGDRGVVRCWAWQLHCARCPQCSHTLH
jgi:hypothetical protein